MQQLHNAIWAQEVGREPTGPQYAVLAVLATWPGADQRTVARRASLDTSSTMEVVARLARRGWLSRGRNGTDARRDTLTLTPSAEAALEPLGAKVTRVQNRMLAALTPGEQSDFIDDLAAVSLLSPATEAESPQWVPGHVLRRAQQRHTALFTATFGRRLTGPQFAVMQVLSLRPGSSAREVGECADLDKSTASDIIARLVARGWIQRSTDASDGRRRLLALTDEGIACAAEFLPRVRAVQDELLAGLEPSRRTRLVTALTRVADTN